MKKLVVITCVLLLGLLVTTSFGFEVTLFGPTQYLRTVGKPNVFTNTFAGSAGWAKITLKNGDEQGNHKVSSALVFLNGQQIFGPNNFNKQVYTLEQLVYLKSTNSISIDLRSTPMSYVSITVVQQIEDSQSYLMQGAVPPPDTFPTLGILQYQTEDGTLVPIEVVEGSVHILFHQTLSAETAESLILANGGVISAQIPSIRYFIVNVGPGRELDFINLMRQNPDIIFALPNIPLYPGQVNEWDGIYKDYKEELSWYHTEINSPLAWATLNPAQLNDIETAIIEQSYSGLTQEVNSLDFSNRIYDIPSFPSTADPLAIHGTAVTSLAAATGNNNYGNVGVNWWTKVRLFTARSGIANSVDYAYALALAVDRGSKVINMSFGSGNGDEVCQLDDKISKFIFDESLYGLISSLNVSCYAYAGFPVPPCPLYLVVKAAGNDNCEHLTGGLIKPSNLIVVGSSDKNHGKASHSDYGTHWVDIAAPGEELGWIDYSSNLLCLGSGTSLAAPLVTGAAALLWSKEPNLTPQQVIQRLKDTAQAFKGSVPVGKFGTGILDVYGALFPIPKSIIVTPAFATVPLTACLQFTATALDQYGNPTTPQPSFTWTSSNTSIGTIDAAGLFTAISAGGPISVTASIGFLGGSASVTVGTPPPPPPAKSPWPMFGHDAQHTGRSEYSGPQGINETWVYDLGIIVNSNYTGTSLQTVIGNDGTIYFGIGETQYGTKPPWGKLYAMNSNGTPRWESIDFESPVFSTPAIGSDGTIYVPTYDKGVYALNPDGTEIWRFYEEEIGYVTGISVGNNGIIYFTSNNRKLYSLNPDGSSNWVFCCGPRFSAARGGPAIGKDGTIYVLWTGFIGGTDGENGALHAYFPDGTLKWSVRLNYGYVRSTPPAIGPDGTIYVATGYYSGVGWRLHAFNQSGEQIWETPTVSSGYPQGSPVIDSNGNIVVAANWSQICGRNIFGELWCSASGLWAFDSNGNLLWTVGPHGGQQSNSTRFTQPIIDSQDTVFIAENINNATALFYSISPQGTIKQQFDIPGVVLSSPVIGADGHLYTLLKEFQDSVTCRMKVHALGQ